MASPSPMQASSGNAWRPGAGVRTEILNQPKRRDKTPCQPPTRREETRRRIQNDQTPPPRDQDPQPPQYGGKLGCPTPHAGGNARRRPTARRAEWPWTWGRNAPPYAQLWRARADTIVPGSAAGPGHRAQGPVRSKGARGPRAGLVATDVGTERSPTRTAMESTCSHNSPRQRRGAGPPGPGASTVRGPPGPRAYRPRTWGRNAPPTRTAIEASAITIVPGSAAGPGHRAPGPVQARGPPGPRA